MNDKTKSKYVLKQNIWDIPKLLWAPQRNSTYLSLTSELLQFLELSEVVSAPSQVSNCFAITIAVFKPWSFEY